MILIGSIPAWQWLAVRYASRSADLPMRPEPDNLDDEAVPLMPAGLAGALALALALSFLGKAIGGWMGPSYISVLVTTLLAVVLASTVPARLLLPRQSFIVGTILMYMFFVTIGFGVDIHALAGHGAALLSCMGNSKSRRRASLHALSSACLWEIEADECSNWRGVADQCVRKGTIYRTLARQPTAAWVRRDLEGARPGRFMTAD